MNIIKNILKSRFELSISQSLVFIFVASIFLAFLVLWIQPDGTASLIKCIEESRGLLLFLNWIPILLFTLFIYFLGFSPIASSAISGFLFSAASVVNRFKIQLRNDPFFPWDLSLGGEVAGIAKSFGLKTIIIFIGIILLYIVIAVCFSSIIKGKRFSVKMRFIGLFICICTAYLLNNLLYKNAEINNGLYVIGNVYNQVDTFNSKGFLYSFIYSFNTTKITRPNSYNPEQIVALIDAYESSNDYNGVKKPHIIMIMGEAFSEISLIDSFDFTGYIDPLSNYKNIKEKSLYGQILVPNLGGGTADTVFDVLTGISTRRFRGAPFAFRLIGAPFESMASVLNQMGYKSDFIHPGHAWFYNRQNVYKYMGFDQLVFINEFEDSPTKGMYVEEGATISRIIEMFEQNLQDNPNTPYFNFCVTIQNHGPYKDKYLVDTNFKTNVQISEDDINAISNYFEGLKDADRELLRLVEYFDNSNEPVVLIYFGDHLPAFTRNVYDAYYPPIYEEGSLEDISRLYKIPFIIWTNQAAKDLDLPINSRLDETLFFSSNYLGAYILEILGFSGISAFMDFVNETREYFPVITENVSFDKYGSASTSINENERQRLLFYRDWEAFKIFDDK